MTFIKICGITQIEDAQAAVRFGVDALGFVFAPSPRRVSIKHAAKISQGLPPHILRFGVFVDQDPSWIEGVADAVGLDRLQFHGQEVAKDMKRFAVSRVVKALHPQPGSAMPGKDPAPGAGSYLVDAYVPGKAGGTGRLSNWMYARALRKFGKPVILSGGLNAGNIQMALEKMRPYMVDLSSGVEIRPGIKHHAKMREIIRLVKQNGACSGRGCK